MTMYGDAVWEAWSSGRNPDAVDYDRMDSDLADGYEPEECVDREVHRIPSYHN